MIGAELYCTNATEIINEISLAVTNKIKVKEIVSTKKVSISNDGYSYDRVLINKNKMLSNYNGATGIKTGYTTEAGSCLISSATKDNIDYIGVVLNSNSNKYGKNTLPKKKKDSVLKIFFNEFKDPLVILLIFAIVASLLAGELVDAIAIFFIVLIDAFLGTYQENKANNTAEALEKLVTVKTKVIFNFFIGW